MAAAGDVSVRQDGGQGNAKLHPYLFTLVRWCVSCLWGTATVILHRLITTPLPSITAKPSPRASPKPRPAGTDHLHPEPRVECVVLHQPATPTLDVIFVHGLYGSLSNTWRQGDWTSKYKCGPNKVPLRNDTYKQTTGCNLEYDTNLNETKFILNQMTIKKILPNEDDFTTEGFYKNSLLKQMDAIENYQTQAKFVEDMFKSDFKRDDSVVCGGDPTNACICDSCDVGCGCVCDKCYSECWPKDWIQRDFPGARVISINYTSDPYLWRPLWVKEIKRLRLHERADQMIRQLLDLGVGSRPIVWVGHSKGGLFIKQIYCEAYEAYIALHGDTEVEGQTLDADIKQLSHPNDVEINDPPYKVDGVSLSSKASLWELSAGFMFYSVPHRGSPLADFKTPITARSIELLEISKDCALVVSLHERWLRATRGGPVVASLVETGRTLMAVLWLRIVSVDSADAGIGSLSGVCVDHREICKPSSRSCQLYTELTDLIRAALEKIEKRESLSRTSNIANSLNG